MTLSQDLFHENNNEKCKNTTERLFKHKCYSAIKVYNIKLWIWIKYHEMPLHVGKSYSRYNILM